MQTFTLDNATQTVARTDGALVEIQTEQGTWFPVMDGADLPYRPDLFMGHIWDDAATGVPVHAS